MSIINLPAVNISASFQPTDLDLTGATDMTSKVLGYLADFGDVTLPETTGSQFIRLNITVPSGCNLRGKGMKVWDRTLSSITNVVTITIATPGVISLNAHGFVAGTPLKFTTTGALPTGLTAGTTYYVSATGLTANAFSVATAPGGSVIATSGTQSGVQSVSIGAWSGFGSLIYGNVDATDSQSVGISDMSVDGYALGNNQNGITGVSDPTRFVFVSRVATRANNHGHLWEKNIVDPTQTTGPVGSEYNAIFVRDCIHYNAVPLSGNGFVSKMRRVHFDNCFAYDCLQAFVAVSDNINGINTYSRAQETYFNNCGGSSNVNTLRVYSRDTRSLSNTYNVQPARDIYWNGGTLGDCSQTGAHIGDFSAQTSSGPVGTQTLLKNEGVWIKGARITDCGQNGLLWTRLDGGGYSDNYFANNGIGGGGFTSKNLDWDTAGNVLNLTHGPNTFKGAALGRETMVSARTASATIYSSDEGVLLTNEGATGLVTLTLPTAEVRRRFRFYVQDADGIRVVAASGDTIRINGSVSAAAGRIDSTTIGSFVELEAINATEWVAISSSGTWTVT